MSFSQDGKLFDEVNAYVFDLYKNHLSQDFVFHNYQHTLETVEACKKLLKGYEVSESDVEILILAAWFHDTGYIHDYKKHEQKSFELAENYLKERNYPKEKLARILTLIAATERGKEPENLLSEILVDADLSNVGSTTFFSKSDLLRAEWENLGIVSCDDVEWEKSQLTFLSSVHFHTQYAQELYGSQLTLNIQEQRQKLQKLEKKQGKELEDKDRIKAQPKRGIETMFRSVYRNHINLSSIADNKANMMISINSLIISITLTIVGAKFSIFGASFSEDQKVIFPIICLLLTSLTAIIFAILSAKPKVTSNVRSLDELYQTKSSILFFGNFTNVSLPEFEEEMIGLMRSEDKLYGNMIKDLYFLGKVLKKKYRLLSLSYLSFMIGLIITVVVAIYVVIQIRRILPT
ncbi:MAG: Pycsar system effector family protein [Cytophagaceae bacterium]